MISRSVVPALFLLTGLGAQASADWLKPSTKEQVDLGLGAAKELRSKQKVLPSTDKRVVIVRQIGEKLASCANVKGKPWKFSFDVIESKEVNAFALPGGPTFIYTGLLDKLTTEDELAGVMGHELTHVIREHWASQVADQRGKALGLGAILEITKASDVARQVVGITNEMIFNTAFSRRHETQADEGGLDLMTKAGFNPQGIVDVFTLLSKQPGGKPAEFLSDHPSDGRRISHMQDLIKKRSESFPAMRPIKLPRQGEKPTAHQ